ATVLGALARAASVWLRPSGLSLGAVGEAGALAFDLLWAPDGEALRLVVANARGAGLRAPALAFALRLLDLTLASLGARRGRVFTIDRAAPRVLTALLPPLGVRVPSTTGVSDFEVRAEEGDVVVDLGGSAQIAALAFETVRALEIASLAEAADELLLAGELDRARHAYLDALERAPRHPDLALAVAEIDVCIGGRDEAALGLLVDSMAATQAGLVGAELLARVGDLVGAREAVQAQAVNETYAPVAALAWAALARHEPSPQGKLAALDRACARAPALTDVRWLRLAARLERRDSEGALADAQQLEATAQGSEQRHEVCSRAARLFLDAGQKAGAGRLFERALRYLPDDAVATAGLARAFMETNKPERAAALLERAVQLGERKGLVDAAALIDLAKVLARQLKDLPAAVARLCQVPAVSPRIIEARALEGRFRASLGDLTGATLAYARLRECVELEAHDEPRAKRWLVEAASFEEDYQRDVFAAERHLAVALRLAPHDEALLSRYRRVAALVAKRSQSDPPSG
ncbi:MAG TPA: tetratricopeptide repeat protein, partial [Polyangiaceae bacterium]